MPLGRRVLVARLAFQRLVLVSAALTVALAATLLTALWIYADAAGTVSVRNAMAAETASETGYALTTTADQLADTQTADGVVREAVDRTFSGVGYDLASRMRTTSTYTLPDRPDELADEELTVFAWYEDLPAHAQLVAGSWPGSTETEQPVEVALPAVVAELLGVAPGDPLTVVQRLDDTEVAVVVTGTYQVVDPAGWYWRSDPLGTTGVSIGQSFPVRGPMVVADPTVLDTAVAREGLSMSWQVGPHWTSATAGHVDAVRNELTTTLAGLGSTDVEGIGPIRSSTRLDEILPAIQRALVANRSMMVIPVLQLAVLAAYTLLLAARLLLEHRRAELALLRARGVSTRQVVQMTVLEAAVLVAPAAVLAPLLALGLLRAVEGRGPFEELGGAVGSPAVSWWVVAATAAVMCGLALVLPALRRDRTYVESQAERGRQARRTAVQRAGADLLLLGGAGVAYWQLRHYQLPVIESGGGVAVDPLLVAGPSLVLFAAGLVALRLLPWIARAAQSVAVARPSLGGALGAWQVSRRPLRYAGPALLLVFALAIGAMSSAYGASWNRSQDDQAQFAAGADLRVTAPARVDVVPTFGQAARLAATPGVEAVVPVWRGDTDLGDETVAVLAIDAEQAPDVVQMRPDLGPPVSVLAEPLVSARAPAGGIPIPGTPASIEVELMGERMAVGPGYAPPALDAPATVRLVILDAAGAMTTTDPVTAALDGESHQASFDLADLARGDEAEEAGEVSYPVRVVGAALTLPIQSATLEAGLETEPFEDDFGFVETTLTLRGLSADGAPVPIPEAVRLRPSTRSDVAMDVAAVERPDADTVVASATSSFDPRPGDVRIELAMDAPQEAIPVVLDRTAAGAASAGVGDELLLTINGLAYNGTVTDVVEAVPGTDPAGGAVLIDFQTWQRDQHARHDAVAQPNEWWISSTDGAVTSAALAEEPAVAPGLVSAHQLRSGLRGLGATTLGALLAGFAAALAFAAVGFTVNLIIGSRERLAEFAVLRAIGLSRREILGMLLVEQAFLVGLGLAVGLAIGAGVSALVVPLVVISPTAGATVPAVLLELPWAVLGMTAVGAATLFGVIVVLAANRLQRAGLGSTLRLGADA